MKKLLKSSIFIIPVLFASALVMQSCSHLARIIIPVNSRTEAEASSDSDKSRAGNDSALQEAALREAMLRDAVVKSALSLLGQAPNARINHQRETIYSRLYRNGESRIRRGRNKH